MAGGRLLVEGGGEGSRGGGGRRRRDCDGEIEEMSAMGEGDARDDNRGRGEGEETIKESVAEREGRDSATIDLEIELSKGGASDNDLRAESEPERICILRGL